MYWWAVLSRLVFSVRVWQWLMAREADSFGFESRRTEEGDWECCEFSLVLLLWLRVSIDVRICGLISFFSWKGEISLLICMSLATLLIN